MVARTLDFVWMSRRGTHILTGSLPEETLHGKCAYTDFFWSVFSRIQAKYGEILNMERYFVSLRIRSKCAKIQTRKTPNTATFHEVKVIRSLQI